MNQQNDNEIFSNSNNGGVNGGENAETKNAEASGSNNPDYTEVAIAYERRPVIKDEKTVSDEAADYIFSSPTKHKKKKKSKHHHHHEEDKARANKRFWKRLAITAICVLLSLILLIFGGGLFLLISGENQLVMKDYTLTLPDFADSQGNGKFIYYNGHTYSLKENLINMLFLGVDKESLDEKKETGAQGQADVIILMTMDTTSRKATMLNIPRDTMTDVTVLTPDGLYVGSKNQQICLSYAYGDGKNQSCENTKSAVQRIFYNLPIETYFSLDLNGIKFVNDSIGGVDVVSPHTIGQFVAGQSYHLSGDTAESFVRTRGEEAYANLKRNERQKVYMNSFMNTVISQTKQDITTPVKLFNATAPYSCTNLNPAKITYLAKEIITGGGMEFSINNIPVYVTVNNDSVENHILEKEFFEQFLSVFYNMVS
ncbi:MAG: LCP family protein [Ruminococcus sp.]|nr:LCP family protein [Ruminococcus sp.]